MVAVVDVDESSARETAAGITANGGRAIAVRADVAEPADVERAVRVVVEQLGRLDVLVNNAAVMTFTPVVETSVEDWDRVLDVNLRSVFLFCKYALPHMRGGAVVNVSSVHAHETTANVAPYAASKGAVEAFTRALAIESEGAKVRVNCVAPGAVDTPMLWANPNVRSGREKIAGSVAHPENIAAVIAFVASDEACFVNGATVVADGGRLNIL